VDSAKFWIGLRNAILLSIPLWALLVGAGWALGKAARWW
jgi:hypothetical protein